jgi:hypothetical protein
MWGCLLGAGTDDEFRTAVVDVQKENNQKKKVFSLHFAVFLFFIFISKREQAESKRKRERNQVAMLILAARLKQQTDNCYFAALDLFVIQKILALI